jgi:hypothetical protein
MTEREDSLPEAPRRERRMKGFERAESLIRDRIRAAGESRGFAVARLLTHWEEIAGAGLAPLCRPVKIGYGKGGLGATLTLLASGAVGPVLQMQLPALRERVNACYGYNAISRIQITQTSAEGFAEAQAAYRPRQPTRAPDAASGRAAETLASGVTDPMLRAALEALGRNVLSRPGTTKG